MLSAHVVTAQDDSTAIHPADSAHLVEQFSSINAALEAQKSEIAALNDSLYILQMYADTTIAAMQTKITAAESAASDVSGNMMLYLIVAGIAILLLIMSNAFRIQKMVNQGFGSVQEAFGKVEQRIEHTKQELEIADMSLDNKIAEMLQLQIANMDQQIGAPPVSSAPAQADHTLALKVAEEMHRMTKRVSSMPDDVKGIGALKNSLRRLEESFNDNGYEMVQLMNQPFHEGLSVSARFVPSDDLQPGEQVITNVTKPQINYKGELIQMGEIEVSVGE